MHHLLKKFAWSCCLLCSAPPPAPLPSPLQCLSWWLSCLIHLFFIFFFNVRNFSFLWPHASRWLLERLDTIHSYRGVVFLQFLGCSVIYTLYGVSVITVCLYCAYCLYNPQPACVSVYFYVPDPREDQRHILVLLMWILGKSRQETNSCECWGWLWKTASQTVWRHDYWKWLNFQVPPTHFWWRSRMWTG